MTYPAGFELSHVFQAVLRVMEQNRLVFNEADVINGNHGDHMVSIFSKAAQAAASGSWQAVLEQTSEAPQANELAEAMEQAANILLADAGNGSALVYARGLSCLAEQFLKYQVELIDLVYYVQKVAQDRDAVAGDVPGRSADVLKALLAALAGWRQPDNGAEKQAVFLDLGAMFDLGIAYFQAKQRNPTRLEAIADAAASVSPLSSVPHRYQSCKVAILALLHALADPSFELS